MRTILSALSLLSLLAIAAPARAAPNCFELSADGKVWSRTAQLLCVEPIKDQQHALTLKIGGPNEAVIARFELALISRVKCIDCNEDVFAIANPENSVFNNALKVVFKGKRDVQKGQETGTVAIGGTTFSYRWMKPAGVEPRTPPPPAVQKAPPPVGK